MIHVARTICRRAERRAVELSRAERLGNFPVIYLNRLSDLLFVLARWENARARIAETKWNV
jgi:cob(I)alamin adenosyltransferase